MGKNDEIQWLAAPEDKDYPAAGSYLALLYEEAVVKELVTKLRQAQVVPFKAKDIFRASRLSLLGVSNTHVEKDRQKVKDGKALSPILLVRDTKLGKLIIADGYHRLCAVYSLSEDESIPCKIV